MFTGALAVDATVAFQPQPVRVSEHLACTPSALKSQSLISLCILNRWPAAGELQSMRSNPPLVALQVDKLCSHFWKLCILYRLLFRTFWGPASLGDTMSRSSHIELLEGLVKARCLMRITGPTATSLSRATSDSLEGWHKLQLPEGSNCPITLYFPHACTTRN